MRMNSTELYGRPPEMYGRPPVAPTAASQPYGRPAVALPRHHNRTGDPRSPFLAVALSGGCPSVRSSLSAVAPAAGRQRGVILMWILMRLDGMKEKVVDPERRGELAAAMLEAYLAERPDASRLEQDAVEQFCLQAPTLVVVVSRPVAESKIPLWEQQLSAGAACTMLLHAAHALGFVASWLTGWAAYSPAIRGLFAGPDDRIAGFMFIGSAGRPLSERPRPSFDEIEHHWRGKLEG